MIMLAKSDDITNACNIIRLAIEGSDRVVYVSCDVYTQAVTINERFNGSVAQVRKVINKGESQVEAIKNFYENAPEPLHMLAPFLALADSTVEGLADDEERMYGVLHYLSGYIDFNKFLLTSEAVRADITVSNVFNSKVKSSYERLRKEYFGAMSEEQFYFVNEIQSALMSVNFTLRELNREVREGYSQLVDVLQRQQPTVIVNNGAVVPGSVNPKTNTNTAFKSTDVVTTSESSTVVQETNTSDINEGVYVGFTSNPDGSHGYFPAPAERGVTLKDDGKIDLDTVESMEDLGAYLDSILEVAPFTPAVDVSDEEVNEDTPGTATPETEPVEEDKMKKLANLFS